MRARKPLLPPQVLRKFETLAASIETEGGEANLQLSEVNIPLSLSAYSDANLIALNKRAKEEIPFSPPTNKTYDLCIDDETLNILYEMQSKYHHILGESEWLDDMVINDFIEIFSREIDDVAFITNTFFYSTLVRADGYCFDRVARWTKNINIFGKRWFICPINQSNVHWILVAVDIKHKIVYILDSVDPKLENQIYSQTLFDNILVYLRDEAEHKQILNASEASWLFGYSNVSISFGAFLAKNSQSLSTHCIRSQSNGFDCGMHVIWNMFCIATGRYNFPLVDMRLARIWVERCLILGKVELQRAPANHNEIMKQQLMAVQNSYICDAEMPTYDSDDNSSSLEIIGEEKSVRRNPSAECWGLLENSDYTEEASNSSLDLSEEDLMVPSRSICAEEDVPAHALTHPAITDTKYSVTNDSRDFGSRDQVSCATMRSNDDSEIDDITVEDCGCPTRVRSATIINMKSQQKSHPASPTLIEGCSTRILDNANDSASSGDEQLDEVSPLLERTDVAKEKRCPEAANDLPTKL